MEILPRNPILEFEKNALEDLRNKYGFDKVERMKEAIDILDTWVRQQNHFVVKNFSRRYLEATIMQCKGSIEKAKSKIDKMCTFRTLIPQFFGDFDLRKDFTELMDYTDCALLPNQAPCLYRVAVIKISQNRFTSDYILHLIRLGVIIGEYLKMNEYSDGFIFICDLRHADVMDMVKNANVVDLRNGMSIFLDGIGARIKGMHLFTESKAIELLVSILKQALSKKIGERITVHRNIEEIFQLVPMSILPSEYGGEAKTLYELKEDLISELSSEEAMEYRRYINTACTDENLRQSQVFKDEYLGMPGSFRVLSVD